MQRRLAGVWRRYRGDVMGGVTVAIVALPLALAFGIASGAGPAAGLYSAIFAGFVTSLFGGSQVQVSGPTGAMTVILVDIVARYGVEGMLLAGAMAGILQIALGAARLGTLVKFLPHSVISGFTNGIAILIFLSQVEPALQNIPVTLVTVAVILLAHRYLRRTIPPSLYGLAAGLAVNQLLVRSPHVVGEIPASLPQVTLPVAALSHIGDLVLPAITIFLLGSIEALLSAEIGDMMTGQRHDSNRELIGQGIGNLVASLVGGVPVTGAIARTAVNVKSGARTRLAGMMHSVVLLLIVLVFRPWAQVIPLAALAGILMVTAVRMADLEGIRIIPRVPWRYGATLLVTMVLTVVQDLTIAVAVGLLLAILFAVADLSVPRVTVQPATAWLRDERAGRRGLSGAVDVSRAGNIQVATLSGPLLFVGVARLAVQLEKMAKGQALILDMGSVTSLDESGGMMLRRLAEDFQSAGKLLYLANVRREPLRVLSRLGVLQALGRRRVCLTMDTALRRALVDTGGCAQSPATEASPLTASSSALGYGRMQ